MAKQPEEDCICMVIAWPNNSPKSAESIFHMMYSAGILKSRHLKVGHAAIVLIPKATGIPEYFDFGRYTSPPGSGRARSAQTDPSLRIKIKTTFDKQGRIQNLEEISNYLLGISYATHGTGSIYFSLYSKVNYALTKTYIMKIQEQGSFPYSSYAPNATNCSRFICGAILAGGTNRWDKLKLLFTPTLRASPLGNVVDVSYESGVYRHEPGGKLENFEMSRLDNLKLLYRNIKESLTTKSLDKNSRYFFNPSERLPHIPETTQWLGGLGEGIWLTLTPLRKANRFRITSYYPDGRLCFDSIFSPKDGKSINPLQSYQFVHTSTRMCVTLEQNGERIRLEHERDADENIADTLAM